MRRLPSVVGFVVVLSSLALSFAVGPLKASASQQSPTAPAAKTSNAAEIVYITKTGAKYHRATCRSLALIDCQDTEGCVSSIRAVQHLQAASLHCHDDRWWDDGKNARSDNDHINALSGDHEERDAVLAHRESGAEVLLAARKLTGAPSCE